MLTMFMASNNKSIALIRSAMNCDCLRAIVDQHGLLPTIGHNKPEEKTLKLFWSEIVLIFSGCGEAVKHVESLVFGILFFVVVSNVN